MCVCTVRSYISSHPPTLQLTADAAQIVSAGLTAREAAVRASVRGVRDHRASVRQTNASAPSVSNVAPRRESAPNAVSFERS